MEAGSRSYPLFSKKIQANRREWQAFDFCIVRTDLVRRESGNFRGSESIVSHFGVRKTLRENTVSAELQILRLIKSGKAIVCSRPQFFYEKVLRKGILRGKALEKGKNREFLQKNELFFQNPFTNGKRCAIIPHDKSSL